MPALLAFDTATDTMAIALRAGGAVTVHEWSGGAHASARLVPASAFRPVEDSLKDMLRWELSHQA